MIAEPLAELVGLVHAGERDHAAPLAHEQAACDLVAVGLLGLELDLGAGEELGQHVGDELELGLGVLVVHERKVAALECAVHDVQHGLELVLAAVALELDLLLGRREELQHLGDAQADLDLLFRCAISVTKHHHRTDQPSSRLYSRIPKMDQSVSAQRVQRMNGR